MSLDEDDGRYRGTPQRNINAWSAQETLVTGNNDRKLNLQANFEDEPGTYTVQFNVSPVNVDPIPPLSLHYVVAQVTWIVEGNQVDRVFNVVDGLSITGQGQAIDVTILDQSLFFGGAFEYQVTALLVKGQRANNVVPPSFLNPLAIVIAPAGGTQQFATPLDNGVESVFIAVSASDAASAAIANDEVRATFSTGPTVGTGTTLMVVPYDGLNKYIPIPAGTRFVHIANDRAAGNIVASTLWGVDG